MDIDLILQQLQNVEEALKCTVCLKKCVDPVKIKACGHYFCLKCFKIKDHVCPNCKTYYEEREVDYNNIAKQTDYLLSELKEYLLQPDPDPTSPTENYDKEVAVISGNVYLSENTFVYNNKTYHVNYIDDICGKVNAKGETPLHIACKRKRLDEVIALLEKKTDLNVKDFAGWAPLHEAVESGSVEIVETLLKNGALVNVPGGEYVTPLHKAVTRENVELIELLLRYKADIETIDYLGKKPLDCTRNENIKNTLNKNITFIDKNEELFCTKKINVYFYYTEESYKHKLSKSKLVSIIKEYDAKKVTHFIIRKTHKLSVKIMVAMLDGCFLLPQEWIDDFFKNNNCFVPIPNYVFISKPKLNNGIRRAVLNSLLKLPKLFDGIYFFIHGHTNSITIHDLRLTKGSISLLITCGGGRILHRAPTPSTCENVFNYPYHSNINGKVSRCCHYLIYEEDHPPTLQYQMAEIKHRTSKWLLDCIINFTICE
ncbi:BRCA1-associated RING domain protein 1-like [Anoplophora glabripennis]|uniref:BRCA1-associated RING domain protein 1-like n=1 Tax=Anoplophora glabripennis TaxID=217634 RepID=UPI00087578D5|nr:BRCA1-associated RING domain protein 1-like [Anoplophora glabripennis]